LLLHASQTTIDLRQNPSRLHGRVRRLRIVADPTSQITLKRLRRHEIHLEIDWAKRPSLELSLSSGRVAAFAAHPAGMASTVATTKRPVGGARSTLGVIA
jgi:hypothetical protein